MKGCNQYTGGKNDTAVAFAKNPPGGNLGKFHTGMIFTTCFIFDTGVDFSEFLIVFSKIKKLKKHIPLSCKELAY